jgi:hypothetical protein
MSSINGRGAGTEPGAPSSTLPPMIDDIAQAQRRALERVGAVTDLDD